MERNMTLEHIQKEACPTTLAVAVALALAFLASSTESKVFHKKWETWNHEEPRGTTVMPLHNLKHHNKRIEEIIDRPLVT
ncbi:hypothetical protein TCAL_17129 [Tigriopus californicus]|uniref:Uncharacterized protein n=1 Tax=Tigriopus californicus TaxID=6832 RepID=A0A553P3P9_TIGCA|nr:hypothetical protein TCAL_17129 [Tigriopus californicus]